MLQITCDTGRAALDGVIEEVQSIASGKQLAQAEITQAVLTSAQLQRQQRAHAEAERVGKVRPLPCKTFCCFQWW